MLHVLLETAAAGVRALFFGMLFSFKTVMLCCLCLTHTNSCFYLYSLLIIAIRALCVVNLKLLILLW